MKRKRSQWKVLYRFARRWMNSHGGVWVFVIWWLFLFYILLPAAVIGAAYGCATEEVGGGY